ncbi:MAG: chloride channel protein, partial [Actinomycetia bacterium]|nr:chloride channel protein [Actinomycetes bacterium]
MSVATAPLKAVLQSRGTASFLLAAAVLGVLVGTATSALAALIKIIESGSSQFEQWSGFGAWVVVVLIPIGMMASWLLNKKFGPGIAGGGVSETMVGLSLHGGYLPTKQIIPKIIATALTLGTGGSGGREGPVVYIG